VQVVHQSKKLRHLCLGFLLLSVTLLYLNIPGEITKREGRTFNAEKSSSNSGNTDSF